MTQSGERRALALILGAVGGILLMAAGLWVAFSLPPEIVATASPSVPPPIEDAEAPRVSLEEAKGAFDARSAVFVDTRSLESYKASHIPGAVSIPLGETEARMHELDPGRWIITYCT